MEIILSTVSWFERQPERTKRWVKRDDLDTLIEVWVGPVSLEDQFKPTLGTPHPEANLMTVTSVDAKRLPAAVSQVTITYQGKFDAGGSGAYTSVPTINQYWSEGEVSYQVAGGVSTPAPGGGFFTSSGTMSYSRRYTGRCVQVAYLTNRRPTGNPTNIGLSKDYLGFTNIWDTFSGFSYGASITSGSPIQQITCTDVKVDDLVIGWYRVTETYQSRMFPGAGQTPVWQSISVQTSLPGAGGGGEAQWAAQEADAIKAQDQADANLILAAESGLPSSPVGSVGWDTANQTGIDPAWGALPNAVSTASNVDGSSESTTAATSSPLDM